MTLLGAYGATGVFPPNVNGLAVVVGALTDLLGTLHLVGHADPSQSNRSPGSSARGGTPRWYRS